MVEVLEQKTVNRHPHGTALGQHFPRLRRREKMPYHHSRVFSIPAEPIPINACGVFLRFAAVTPEIPQWSDHSTARILCFRKFSRLDPTLLQYSCKSADPVALEMGYEMPLHFA